MLETPVYAFGFRQTAEQQTVYATRGGACTHFTRKRRTTLFAAQNFFVIKRHRQSKQLTHRRDDPAEMTQLFVHVLRRANRAGDFFAQKLPVPATQTGKLAAKCIDRDIEPAGNFIVTRQAYATS